VSKLCNYEAVKGYVWLMQVDTIVVDAADVLALTYGLAV